jgi:hypothetical protein
LHGDGNALALDRVFEVVQDARANLRGGLTVIQNEAEPGGADFIKEAVLG